MIGSSRCGQNSWWRLLLTGFSAVAATPAGWLCASPGCCAIGKTRQPPRPTRSMRCAPCCSSLAKLAFTTCLCLLEDADVVNLELPDQRRIGEPDVPSALPVVDHHHVQDQLHRPILDLGRVGELGALDTVDVPRD